MSKGLEDFKELKKTTCFYCQYHINEECENENECIWKTIEKELVDGEKNKQALEIIKSKPVNTDWFTFYKDYDEYYLECEYANESKRLTEKEWNFLKEVLL